ncbi:MAG: hypothetical protein HUJ84_05800, partial [Veillonella sp.]|nr:hypothetical protein [Veillonella sp.]
MKQNKKLVLAVTAAVLGATSLAGAINPVVIGPEGIQFSQDTSAGKGIDVDTKGGVIAFDSNTTANTVSSTDNAKTGEPGNFVVGQSNTVETTEDSTSVFGNQNYVKGANANAYGDGNIAIGTTTQAFGDNNLTQGNYAVNYGIDNIVGGAFTNEELVQDRRPINTDDAADKSVAMGRANVITGSTNAIAIGTSNSIGTTDDVSDSSAITTKNAADNAVVLGTENKTLASNSIVIGQKNELTGLGDYEAKKAIAIGYQITAAAAESIGIGDGASAIKTNAVAIGTGTSAGAAEGDVALGANSETSAVVATKEASITSGTTTIKYGDFAGNAPTSAVSIGKAGAERQLQNVAAGQITDKSTDAINGSQLYATNTVVANLANTTAQGFGGTSKVDDKGNVTVGLTVGDKNFTNVQDALN